MRKVYTFEVVPTEEGCVVVTAGYEALGNGCYRSQLGNVFQFRQVFATEQQAYGAGVASARRIRDQIDSFLRSV